MVKVLWALALVLCGTLHASEVVNSDGIIESSDVESGGLLQLLDKARPETLNLGRMSFPNHITKDRGEIVQYICQTRDGGAGSLLPSGQFCAKWAELESKISKISQATGYPSAVMECTFLIESRFRPGLTSPAGAKGLSQFMPATASEIARAAASDPTLKKMVSDVRKTNPRHSFTADDILGQTKDVDAQLLATPIFYRHYYKAFEKTWANIIERDPKRATDFYHFLVIGYNAGPKKAETFLHNIQRGMANPLANLPVETQKYTASLDKCMMGSGSSVHRPGPGRSDCANLQKGSHACSKQPSP